MHRKAGYVQREFIQAPLKDRCQNTVQLLVDIHLMMHADYFVGTHLSLTFPQSASRSLRFASSSKLSIMQPALSRSRNLMHQCSACYNTERCSAMRA